MFIIAGCKAPTRVATRVTDVPRVDLELTGGNRGYLLGTPPEAGETRTTRQIIETDIELPSFYKPKKSAGAGALAPSARQSSAVRVGAPPSQDAEEAAGPVESYVVQKGESLWSIAAKPEVYGKATQWPRLLEANRELLKGDPNRLRAGMTITIPRGKVSRGSSDEDGGTVFQK
ncbi:MAG: LysM peptidoglycan-binding domain-containing protein [Candidatus Omnitrophica bacterium]|nr:LysM peptidoglycan-binding domain-containing protein [Candidatus Omnitrophota bacterium]